MSTEIIDDDAMEAEEQKMSEEAANLSEKIDGFNIAMEKLCREFNVNALVVGVFKDIENLEDKQYRSGAYQWFNAESETDRRALIQIAQNEVKPFNKIS